MAKSTRTPAVKPATATAQDVREYFRSDEKRIALLSPEAQRTVQKGARGSLHPEAVALHNKRRKVQYVKGNSKAAMTKSKSEAQALREAAREAGFKVGARGVIPKAALAALKG